MVNHDQGLLYNFGTSATYTCPSGLKFEDDRLRTSLEVECLTTGKFDYPSKDPKCVASKKLSVHVGLPVDGQGVIALVERFSCQLSDASVIRRRERHP